MFSITDRKTIISDIIGQRKPVVAQIEHTQVVLNQELLLIQRILTQNEEIRQLTQSNEWLGTVENIKSKMLMLQQELQQIRRRFDRATINIGVIGGARNGKSTLLQRLTGLGTEIIPSSDGGHCTGIRSFITHSQVQSAEILWHTPETLVTEVLFPYYRELMLGELESLGEFLNILPPLPTALQQSSEKQTMYHDLQQLREFIKIQQHRLTGRTEVIDLHDLRQYISQEAGLLYHAVNHARITTPFPIKDVGDISVIDLPGLGNINAGDPERMLKALQEELDIALVVRRPRPNGDDWMASDTLLYDQASNALPGLRFAEWAFLVLNWDHSQGDNLTACKRFHSELQNKHMLYQDTFIIDCSNHDSVQHDLLDHLLNYLSTHITDLDQKFLRDKQLRFQELQQFLTTFCAEHTFPLDSLEVDYEQFEQMWEQVKKALRMELNQLERNLRQNSNNPDEHYTNGIEQIIRTIQKQNHLPSENEFEAKWNEMGSMNTAYNWYLDEMLGSVTNNLLHLNVDFEKSINEVKEQIARIFLTTGRLGFLDLGDPLQFFETFPKKAMRLLTRQQQILRALAAMREFRLSFQGFSLPRIIPQLALLSPDTTINANDSSSTVTQKLTHIVVEALGQQTSDEGGELSVEDCLDYLFNTYRRKIPNITQTIEALTERPSTNEAVQRLRLIFEMTIPLLQDAMQQLTTEPSKAKHALVMLFNHQMRSAEIEGELKQWYRAYRQNIWPEVYREVEVHRLLVQNWNALLDQMTALTAQSYPMD